MFETENIEFKLQFTDNIYREVIAFANTDGGVIYVGIDDNGNIVGIDNVDDTYTRITNGIREAIMPDVTMFIKYTVQDNRVIRITVGEGSCKPYYLKSKGIKSNGVFVRQGATSVPASHEQIRLMIKESDGDVFEKMRSVEQDLTFDSAKQAFDKYDIEFSDKKYRTLGLLSDSDELYTNMALIISDQSPYSIKVAVFADEFNTEFRDSKEFCGSVFEQLEKTYSYLTLCNKTKASFRGLERIESTDYPREALREALLNAIVHRDYSFSGSIIVNVNDKEIEFISIGGLLPGLSTDDIRSGISQPRNKNLAEVFHRLHLIESYGTGIRRIYKLYANCSEQPRIEVTPNTFKIVLPNMNSSASYNLDSTTMQKTRILEYIEENGSITETEIQELLGIKRTRTYVLTKEMCEEGLIRVSGRGIEKRFYRKT